MMAAPSPGLHGRPGSCELVNRNNLTTAKLPRSSVNCVHANDICGDRCGKQRHPLTDCLGRPAWYLSRHRSRIADPYVLGMAYLKPEPLIRISRAEALEALKRFKNIADKHSAKTIRAVATSAMREAKDGPAFIKEAAALGVNLEVLSGEDEARLISLGILSGLKFDPPLGLFMDIGGGSAELAVGNRSSSFVTFSVPIGAVRLTEHYLRHDPPTEKELMAMNRAVKQKLAPAVRRLNHEKFTMAFGSGGTMTSLADIDSRMTGEAHQESLYVLRRARLKSLYDLMRTQHLKDRAALIAARPETCRYSRRGIRGIACDDECARARLRFRFFPRSARRAHGRSSPKGIRLV